MSSASLAEAGLDLHAELVGPRLRAVEADAQRQVLRPQAAVARGVGQVHGVGRRAAQGGGAEVAHDLELPLGVAAGDGHDGAAQALGAEVQAEPAGEEAVAEGVLEEVARRHAARGEGPGDQVGPDVEVAARVPDGGRVAGGPGAGVHAHDVLARAREHAERVVVAQVDLGGEGQVGDVAVAGHVAGLHAQLVHRLAVERDVVVGVLEGRAQPLDLELAELAVGQRLGGRLPVQPAGGVLGQVLLGSGGHRARTSSSLSSVTLPSSSSTARSMSRTAKQMFQKEMLYR